MAHKSATGLRFCGILWDLGIIRIGSCRFLVTNRLVVTTFMLAVATNTSLLQLLLVRLLLQLLLLLLLLPLLKLLLVLLLPVIVRLQLRLLLLLLPPPAAASAAAAAAATTALASVTAIISSSSRLIEKQPLLLSNRPRNLISAKYPRTKCEVSDDRQLGLETLAYLRTPFKSPFATTQGHRGCLFKRKYRVLKVSGPPSSKLTWINHSRPPPPSPPTHTGQ